MQKIQIAFDLDGTLIDIMIRVKELIFEIYKIELKENTRYKFEISNPELSKNQIWEIIRMVYQEVKTTPIYPGATELLTKLYEKTKEPPLIVTARPFDSANDTYAIVKRIMKKAPFALILKHDKCHKADYLHGYQFYVEDRRKTAIELSDMGFGVPLIRKNYNHIPDVELKHPNIYYIEGVHELIDYIDDLIL